MVKVECDACGKRLNLESERDEWILNNHAKLHIVQDESFREEFNDSPITFPIMYSEVKEDDNGW